MASASGDGSNSRGFGLRVQKKLLGKLASKNTVKGFIDDKTVRLLDNVYLILKDSMPARDAKTILNYLIKVIVKVVILHRNNQFNAQEEEIAGTFRIKFKDVRMRVVNYYETPCTYDKDALSKLAEECREVLQMLIQRHVRDKTKSRIDKVFSMFKDPDLMDDIFRPDGKHRGNMKQVIVDLKLMTR